MKIPYGWIREFVETALTAQQAAETLINGGVEVPAVTPLAPNVRGVVIGRIDAIEREVGESRGGYRLFLCRVTTGRDSYSVVCGAPNTAVGVHAAFAPPGAAIPGDGGAARPIGVARIHGVESQGMLCSERELGIGEEHEAGILVVDGSVPPGTDLAAHLGLDDHVLEIEITPNRPDCLSVVGVARELAALTGARLAYPRPALTESDEAVTALARVRIDAPDLCRRFTARVISDVKVAPSPAWMAARLRVCGLRPISNVVDITNYVMWELGHPLHAFDYRAVTDATIVVRRAQAGEHITTLDGQDRALDPSMLLITNPKRGVGIAGVMGGANTEVTDATTRVLLESAYFEPASVRRTARGLGLLTDAAYRFERGADIDGLVDASARAAQLMAELAGGRVARGMIDVYPNPKLRPRIRLRMDRVRRVIGIAPPKTEAHRMLGGLGLSVSERGDDLDVEVPTFRRDLAIEDDLVEEIIRVWGYDRIPSTLPGGTISIVRRPASFEQAEIARRALVGAGLFEAVTMSLTDPSRGEDLAAGELGKPVSVLHPLSQEAAQLREHPLDGLLGAVAVNLRRQQSNVRLFEIARTYHRHAEETHELRWVAIALAGARADAAWYARPEPVDVYDAKGMAEHVLDVFGADATTGAGRLGGFEDDAHAALVLADGTIAAEFGEVAEATRATFGIDVPVFAAVVSFDALAARHKPVTRYESLPRYPAVQRDMAFVMPGGASPTAAQVEDAIRAEAGPLLRDVALFDVFRVPDGRVSLAWRLTFQAPDRTLTDEEVNAIHARVAVLISERFTITLRGVS